MRLLSGTADLAPEESSHQGELGGRVPPLQKEQTLVGQGQGPRVTAFQVLLT